MTVIVAVESRVVGHILDAAAVAVEHGNEMLADILKGEAHALKDGSLQALAARAECAEPAPVEFASADDALAALHVSRTHAEETRSLRIAAMEKATEIISGAWLREGYAVPA